VSHCEVINKDNNKSNYLDVTIDYHKKHKENQKSK